MSRISRETAIKVIYWNVVAAVLVIALAASRVVRRHHAYDSLIVEIGRAYKVDPRLVSAVIWQESRFDVVAVGDKGELGLMQVTEPAAREWAEAEDIASFRRGDLFNPETNIRAGTWYLARAINRWSEYSDPLPYALAEYNAGRSNALRWAENTGGKKRAFIEAITYPTTLHYLSSILRRYRGRV
jgi:soluble lytic murein transglycosylase